MKDIILDYIKNCGNKIVNNITYDTPLISGGILDSFSMVSVLVFIENTFNVKISYDDAIPENFDSVNKIYQLIEINKNKKNINGD